MTEKYVKVCVLTEDVHILDEFEVHIDDSLRTLNSMLHRDRLSKYSLGIRTEIQFSKASAIRDIMNEGGDILYIVARITNQ